MSWRGIVAPPISAKTRSDELCSQHRDLGPGERLDDFGGFTYYGCIDSDETAQALNTLPVGLAPGAEVLHRLPAGHVLTWDDVRLDETSTVVRLRRQQDGLL
jgi:predicted homoserine dehydrogenase-like protein